MKNFSFGRITFACFTLLTAVAPPAMAGPPVEFSNPGLIAIYTPRFPRPDGHVAPLAADPYPSTINVAGFPANETIEKITVTLHGLSHETPDDIDILLVGPEGQNIVLFSDAGGGFVDPNLAITVTLDDDAATSLPDNDPMVSGTFKPSNYELEDEEYADLFPEPVDENGNPTGPAPEPSSATTLSTFAGTHPNGGGR